MADIAARDEAAIIPAIGEDGSLTPIGKLEAHRRGTLHLAVSIFVFDQAGRLLVQRRAQAKYHCPGQWANTACTHPHWGESLGDAAERRLREEIGLSNIRLTQRLTTSYRADVGNGMVENEKVTFFTGEADSDTVFSPDPDEVAETAWLEPEALAARLHEAPHLLTPWFRIYLERFPDLRF